MSFKNVNYNVFMNNIQNFFNKLNVNNALTTSFLEFLGTWGSGRFLYLKLENTLYLVYKTGMFSSQAKKLPSFPTA